MEHPNSNIISDVENVQILRMDENKREPALTERRIMIDCLFYYKQYFAKWDDDNYYDISSDDDLTSDDISSYDDLSSDDEIYKTTHTPAPVQQSPTSQIENAIKTLEEGAPYEDIRRAYGGILA
ncbi:hypothetical protein BC936DRAFT_139541 [Jimgerdemannia flammicorona]|uniref:Uncharacterized protein n=1 Tax=Jimgerdemannia flammicorona TaxID=994334 RepID=A0A433DHL4_9FUNG|nr:hypothetical protein BC936DRAFT_139541 [Jimgerdemannia flammicorona]